MKINYVKINYDLIGQSLIHPVQKEILRVFANPPNFATPSRISPKELAKLTGVPLATVSYHVRLLAGLSCGEQRSHYAAKPLLHQVDTKQRRGATEHFYALTSEAATIG